MSGPIPAPDWDRYMDEMEARAKVTHARAADLMQANPDLPFMTAVIMAGDLEQADRATAALLAGEPWEACLPMVGSYGRIGWLNEHFRAGRIPAPDAYRSLVHWWSASDPDDTEPAFLDLWVEAWRANGSRTLLDDPEQPLPKGTWLTVYRGQGERDKPGIAWSLSQEVAGRFANGAAIRVRGGVKDPVIYTGRVRRQNVMAYLTDRDEAEVIVSPLHVHG